jgi:hypothetical protein
MKTKKILLTAIVALYFTVILDAQVPSYVPTNGLVAWYPFNSNANDESGNGNNGINNGATLTADRNGNANKAYSFNGNNITTSYSGISGNGARTISFWYNLSQNTSQTDMVQMVGYGGSGLAGGSWGCAILQNQPLIDVSASYAVYNATANINSWYFYCVTYDQSDGSNVLSTHLYINGILQTSTTFTYNTGVVINTGKNSPLIIGSANTPESYFYGKLDDIGIWSRALTQVEITKLFNSSTTSAIEATNKVDIKVYPNPASTVINLETNTPFINADYILKDLLGKTILSGKILNGNTTIEIENLSKGIYLLNVGGDAKKQTFKIVKE